MIFLERGTMLGNISGEEIESTVFGWFLATIGIGVILQLGNVNLLSQVGGIVGSATNGGGWLALGILSVLLSVMYVVFVGGSINSFVTQVLMLTSKSEILNKILSPFIKRSAFLTTTSALGLIYGVILAIVVGGIGIPVWLNVVSGQSTPLFNFDLLWIVAWILYGTLLGVGYGLANEI